MDPKVTNWHEKVLDKNAKYAAECLAPLLARNFYLAGGTALALYYGHRVSHDLDLFSATHKLLLPERIQLIESLKKVTSVEITESTDGTCHLLVEKTAVSLFYYPYALISQSSNEWRGIPIASLEDISAMKLNAVLGRGSKKDFIDIFWLAQEESLKKILDNGGKKFSDYTGFFLQACRALVYFEDAEKEPMPKMLKNVKWQEIKKFFSKEIPKILSKEVKLS